MEAVSTPATNGDRRKSGRSVRAPQIFSQEVQSGSAKRKRNENDVVDDVEDIESSSDSDEDGEPDEEELSERNRRKKAKPGKKPAVKRPKTVSGSRTLAIRSANGDRKNVTKAAKTKARSRESQVEQTGLYADVFGHNNDAETAANLWHNVLVEDNVGGVRDIVNLVLQTIGCDQRIDEHDIGDADNITGRLRDVITEYEASKPEDYPLSGRQKGYHAMRAVFTEFFRAVPHTLHNSGLFYSETAIWENIHTWLGVMSGAAYRSFRHTATIAELALTTGLTEVGREIRDSISTSKQQLEAAKKKKSNAARIKTLQEEMDADQKKLEMIDAQINDAFETVFAHRYRDIDERLRAECAAALGTWIIGYSSMFLEGTFLRYLGWVLSDAHATTRLEVVRQLKKIYNVRDNLSSMRGFSERFRQRIVEMGTKDVDTNVRVEAIELLNQMRSAEYLVPEDIDAVGQLIFDNEPRIRKAVANFFVSNIEDLYAASVEDFDPTDFNEELPNVEDVDDFVQPCKTWIKFKCLAQTLGAQTKDPEPSSISRLHATGIDHLDSRYMVATRAIFASMSELTEWESLAGYLLFDHSSIPALRDGANLSVQVKNAYKLSAGEDIILLDVLYCAAKLELAVPETGKKLTKAQRDEQQQKLSTAIHNLSVFIPQLHSKYGSEAQAAKSILRLHQLYNADLMDDADEGQRDTDVMLKDIKAQFKASHDPEVLNEVSRTLRTALTHEVSRQATEEAIEDLWHDLVFGSVAGLLKGKNLSGRGTLDRTTTRQLPEVLSRFVYLSGVQDCCNLIEGKMVWPGKRGKSQANQTVMDVLLDLVRRGEADDDTTREIAEYEDQTASAAIQVLAVYYRWKVVAITQAITLNDRSALSETALNNLSLHKNELVEALLAVVATRRPLNTVRVSALLNLVELQVLFATLRHKKPTKGDLGEETVANINVLVTPLSSAALSAILESHEAMEVRLGRRMGKKNISRSTKRKSAGPDGQEEDVQRPPEDSDEEAEADDESDDGDEIEFSQDNNAEGKEIRRKAAVLAEKALCEFTAKIVLAVIINIVPKDVKTRLMVNKTKLGKSYTQVLAYLDDKKLKGHKKDMPKTPPRKLNGKVKSSAMVHELTDDEDDREEDDPDRLREQGLADDQDDPVQEADDEDVPVVEEEDEDMIGD